VLLPVTALTKLTEDLASLRRMPTSPLAPINAHSATMRLTTSSAVIGLAGAFSVIVQGLVAKARCEDFPYGGRDFVG
jgi:hypothetical protein